MYYIVKPMRIKDDMTGQFALKGDEPRQIRSIRLTDGCWEALGQIAASKNQTRADFIEGLYENDNFEEVEQEIDADTIANLLEEFVSDMYDENEYDIPSRDKAVIKRFMPTLIEYLRDNL